MIRNNKVIKIFFSYAFKPAQNAYSLSEFQTVFKEAIDNMRIQLGDKAKKVDFYLDFQLSEYGGMLNSELLTKMRSANICVIDVSDNNPNVLYELGHIHALNKKSIIIKSKKDEEKYPIPTDLSGIFYLKYDSLNTVKDELVNSLKKKIESILDSSELNLDDLRQLWFPENTTTINVIGPSSQAKTEFAEIESPNYTYLQRFGDKDALLEILVLLSRLYPHAKIRKYMSEDFDFHSDLIKEDLVVLGGPGEEDAGNKICKLITERMGSKVSYSEDCENMCLQDGKILSASYDRENKIKLDHGYFGRIPNPFNPNSSVVLIHGIHTFGVLGATRAFSDDPLAIKNVEVVLDRIGLNPYFESWFPVNVINGFVTVPEIKEIHSVTKDIL